MKINTLVSQLKKLKKAEPATKCVIFSQFTSFLDVLASALQSSNIAFLQQLNHKDRAKKVTAFTIRRKFTVLLLSLRDGGVGLNLACVKRVFMMDLWWSFAVKAQAIDRVHRMGRSEQVTGTRFVVSESIEEKLL